MAALRGIELPMISIRSCLLPSREGRWPRTRTDAQRQQKPVRTFRRRTRGFCPRDRHCHHTTLTILAVYTRLTRLNKSGMAVACGLRWSRLRHSDCATLSRNASVATGGLSICTSCCTSCCSEERSQTESPLTVTSTRASRPVPSTDFAMVRMVVLKARIPAPAPLSINARIICLSCS